MHKKEKFVQVEPLVGYISPDNGEYITMADIERARAELVITGPTPRHEQRPSPYDPGSLKRQPSQYIHA
ncbi:MAG: hypothetical protein A3A58_00065 [Candidatus Blackburnbacteria bacterium RIFCSPLOWO2_01_FULL_41_27]|uniref:Uncharacterized protein n=2 Tax=Candidatus Blackburniibacteriota TaxID=1817898 RepID=A0A1G1V8S1_9BACT|nr:MAG: hypothetical protein A3F61_01775 [Candidatus Blackburnbacteria bacterium RIFCSPHIGHO2_12_FULL_41_13b]OGY14714.1 MAG: hypothetical protein A3A58_00065 [Candidatus Blackburnbacteria bacterium RIFCSPLOWO2_01_FULL_41_27]